jgi:hypothetical protein
LRNENKYILFLVLQYIAIQIYFFPPLLLGHRYSQQRETFNESRGTTPWAKISSDEI